MYILGIDPGFGRLGYGIIEYRNSKYRLVEYGCITTPANERLPSRLKKIQDDLEEIISRYNIDEASVEDLFFNTNIRTGIQVAEARGVILCTLEKHGIKINEYTPLQVKQAITGYGKADKQQMQKMVQVLLNLDSIPKPDDAADALAIALCCGNSERF